MKAYAIVPFFLFGCMGHPPDTTNDLGTPGVKVSAVSDVVNDVPTESEPETLEVLEVPVVDVLDIAPEQVEPEPEETYPEGPYALELFGVIPNMSFYDPWEDTWIELSDYFSHGEHKALLIASSAGWCGPCLKETAALIEIYEKYHEDGLEIVYTMGNTNIIGDAPFDNVEPGSAGFHIDLEFMEAWAMMASDLADKKLNYKLYADPNREFIKYFPNHSWPLSMLVTTKDMGIRLIQEGYWSALIENKIMLVLYNDVPTIPFE